MVNNYPKVSVVMGIYNCSGTLEKAVECIISQTYNDWELIMCDDCSTDNTYAIALNIAARDKRIRVIKNDLNLTLAPTLNKCIAMAKGKYIARMDGDDICSIERLEKEVIFLENHPEYALVSCNMDLSDSYQVFRTIKYLEEPTLKDFLHNNMHCHAASMMRADVIKYLGGYSESINRRRVEDFDLWVRMYSSGYHGYNIQESLYTMVDNTNAYKRRSLLNRINESRVIINVCRNSNCLIYEYIFCLVPIIKWFVPSFVYYFKHRKTGKVS